MMLPYLKLTDDDGSVYSFPISFFITEDGASTRSTIRDLLYAHGGRQIADGFVKPRQITIDGSLHNDTQAGFETAYRALSKAVLKGGKLSISSDSPARYLTVNSPSIDSAWDYFPLRKEISITFNAPFPFWEDETEITDTHVLAGDDTFTVDASGADALMLPVIQIDADQGVDIPSIVLRNSTDGGAFLRYENPLFTAGAMLTIDSKEGSIKLNNNDAIQYVVSGSFPRLQAAVNTLLYEGAACTITVTYRRVYL